jgi:Radical SAM superfamily
LLDRLIFMTELMMSSHSNLGPRLPTDGHPGPTQNFHHSDEEAERETIAPRVGELGSDERPCATMYADEVGIDKVEVVLFSPPYYRFCGSHNNRLSPSLTYLAAYLERASVSHVIYNADATRAERFWSMSWMFRNFESFIDAVNGKGSLYGEIIEILMGFEPRTVVIAGAEPLIATKDWANPFIAANFSKLLRGFGVYTVGLGHFFTLDRARFEDAFDCVMGGEPSAAIVDIVTTRPRGFVEPRPIDLDIVPKIDRSFPEKQKTDFVMTSFGCRFPCSFCLVQQFYKFLRQPVRFADLDTVVEDIAQRPEEEIYLTDLTFTMAPKRRLRDLAARLREAGVRKRFVIDTRADCLSEEIVDLLIDLNVTQVKIGVEGATEKILEVFNKGSTLEINENAIALLRSRGMKVLTYLLIGGSIDRRDFEATRAYIQKLQPDFVPVAIWAYDLSTDYRYDTQFSPVRLREWGIPEDVFFDYLSLQDETNPTVGKLLDLQ